MVIYRDYNFTHVRCIGSHILEINIGINSIHTELDNLQPSYVKMMCTCSLLSILVHYATDSINANDSVLKYYS